MTVKGIAEDVGHQQLQIEVCMLRCLAVRPSVHVYLSALGWVWWGGGRWLFWQGRTENCSID